MNEPYFYLIGLTLVDLEDLVADIKVNFNLFGIFVKKLSFINSKLLYIQIYMELEKESNNLDYWNDLMVIVEDEVRALRKVEQTQKSEYEAAMGRQEASIALWLKT